MPVYVICVMNFLPKSESINKFRTDVALREKKSESVFSDKLRMTDAQIIQATGLSAEQIAKLKS